MDQKNQDKASSVDKVLIFDTIFTNNHIKMLKVLLSYFDPEVQKMLAVYIKFLELQHTLAYFKNHSQVFPAGHSPSPGTPPDISNLCQELLPYCTQKERERIGQLRQMQQSMENFRQMQQMMEMMKELFPDGFPSFSGNENSSETENENENGNKNENESGGGMPFSPELLASLMGGENTQMLDMISTLMKGFS